MCLLAGSTAGGVLPTLFGFSSLGAVSLLCSGIGAVAGVWAAARISESF